MRAMHVEGFKGKTENRRNLVAFWLLGALNNCCYVIMLAGANSVSSGAVGLVYLAAVTPGICLKATFPYWAHRMAYSSRVLIAAALMAGSYTAVALTAQRGLQLAGVVLASLQGSLGEASCLSLTAHYNSQAAITAWSSGTGFAGVFGYAWVALLHIFLGWSFRSTLLAANATAVAWVAVYFLLLEPPEARARQVLRLVQSDEQLVEAAMAAMAGRDRVGGGGSSSSSSDAEDSHLLAPPLVAPSGRAGTAAAAVGVEGESSGLWQSSQPARRRPLSRGSKSARMGLRERLLRTAALWPYTVPLLTVYFSEYAMQSGTWAVIGFPVTDPSARQRFYVYANWTYQAGVFLSRSSGTIWQAGRAALWLMPAMQLAWLAFFLADGVHHFWYNWGLLAPCFMTGLLGGAVYVNAFTLLAREVEPQYKEFSLGAASVADSLGVALADVAGILIQGCLFKANGLAGADYKC